jgi:hypothetical protein
MDIKLIAKLLLVKTQAKGYLPQTTCPKGCDAGTSLDS